MNAFVGPQIACSAVRAKLDGLLDGDVSLADRDVIRAHLACCQECRSQAQVLRTAALAVWALPSHGAKWLLPRHVLWRWKTGFAGPRVVMATLCAVVCALALAASPHLVATSPATLLAVAIASAALFGHTWAAIERPSDAVFSARAVAWGLTLAVALSCVLLDAFTIPRAGSGILVTFGAVARSAALAVGGVVFAVGLGMGLLLGRVSLANMGALLVCYAALMLPTMARISPLLFDPRDLGFWMALLSLVGLAGAFLGEVARNLAGPAFLRPAPAALVLLPVKESASDDAR